MIVVYGLLGLPSPELTDAAASATLVVGGARHLDALGVPAERRVVLGRIDPAIEALRALPADADAVVVASGDPLFYGVVRRMRASGLRVRVVPAVGSLQAAFAAVALPWDDALLVSAHGNDPTDALRACREHPKVGVLTDPRVGLPQLLAATRGLGRTYVLAERLGESDECVRVLSEADAARIDAPAQPHVVLVLAHHPDDPAAWGVQRGIAGGVREWADPPAPTAAPDLAGASHPTIDPEPAGAPLSASRPEPAGASHPTIDPEPAGAPHPTAHPEPPSAPLSASRPEPAGAHPSTAHPEPPSAPHSTSHPEPASAPPSAAHPEPPSAPPSASHPEPANAPHPTAHPEPEDPPLAAGSPQRTHTPDATPDPHRSGATR